MSEPALTPDALGDGAAAPQDGTPAPAPAVDDGRTGFDPANYVEVERFNGLMSAHQKSLDDARRADETYRAQMAQYETELANLRKETPSVSDNDALLDEIRALRAEAAEARLQEARTRVLSEFPDAEPFADLIVGSSEDDLRNVAAALSERVATIKGTAGEPPAPTATTEASATTPVTPEVPPTVGGAVEVTPEQANEKLAQAIAAGNWSEYLAVKSAQATATVVA